MNSESMTQASIGGGPAALNRSTLRRTRWTDHEAVERHAAHFAAIVASSTDAIIGKDTNGIITSWNPAACAMFGYEAHEMIGQTLLKLIPHERRGEEPMILAKIRAGESVKHFETVRQSKSGAVIHVSVNTSPIKDMHGRIVGASKIVRDISDRIQSEKSQAQTRSAMEQATIAKNQFLAALSHELRTPLNAVLGFAQLMRTDKALTDSARDCLKEIESAGHHLVRIAGSIFDLADHDASAKAQPPLKKRVKDLLSEGVCQAGPQAAQQGVTLQLRGGEGDGITFTQDAARVGRAFTVILDNAIKLCRPGGQLVVTSLVDAHQVRLQITGTGQSIDKHQQGVVLACVEGPLPDVANLQPIAIDLVITQRIMESMGGNLGFTCNEDEGSTFWLALPLCTPAP